MTQEARRELKAAESAEAYSCPYETAVAHLLLGDKDKAVEYLWKAVPVRSSCMMFMRFDPRLTRLREDPRYQADYLKLLDEVRLDDARLEKYPREAIMESQLPRTQ
jgi:hypothetical protein